MAFVFKHNLFKCCLMTITIFTMMVLKMYFFNQYTIIRIILVRSTASNEYNPYNN